MRRLLSLTIALAMLVALAAAPTAGAAAKKPTCSVKGSKTVVQNSQARVYTLKSRKEFFGNVLYGCLRSSARKVRLASNYDDGYVTSQQYSKVGLNGRFVVFHFVSTDVSCKADCPPGYEPTSYQVIVTNLRTRKVTRYNGRPKDKLFVTATGIPAWLQDAATPGVVEVHAANQVLDTGVINGLALAGFQLSWVNSGQTKSATLS
jgi:hypothetical protein